MEGVPDFILPASRDNRIACTCLLFYALQAAKQKDHIVLMRILPTLAHCDTEVVYQDTFLHLLIAYVSSMPDHFANPDFLSYVVDIFIMVSFPNSSQKKALTVLLCK